MRLFAPVIAAGTAVLAIAVTTTHATAPGSNGLLVYEANVGKHSQVFTVAPDGSATRQVTHFRDSDAGWASWSPDGTRLAVERGFRTHADIYTMNADGSDAHNLTPRGFAPHGYHGEPAWSPDGRLITFGTYRPGRDSAIWVMDADGHNARRVTSNPLPAHDPCGCIGQGSSVFSPDGTRIAFGWAKGAHRAAVFTVNTAGGGLKQLTPWRRGLALKIDWSPDGSRITYSSPEFGPGRRGISANVFTIHPDGTGLVQLTHDHGGKTHDGADSFSPDGTQIVFHKVGPHVNDLYTIPVTGGAEHRLTHLGARVNPRSAGWGSRP